MLPYRIFSFQYIYNVSNKINLLDFILLYSYINIIAIYQYETNKHVPSLFFYIERGCKKESLYI
jgi:hypothetical protein